MGVTHLGERLRSVIRGYPQDALQGARSISEHANCYNLRETTYALGIRETALETCRLNQSGEPLSFVPVANLVATHLAQTHSRCWETGPLRDGLDYLLRDPLRCPIPGAEGRRGRHRYLTDRLVPDSFYNSVSGTRRQLNSPIHVRLRTPMELTN